MTWRQALPSKGLGGVAATEHFVLVSARELMDTADLYLCLHADTGKEAWRVVNLAAGELDYGNSPRCTPLIHEGKVYLAGAFGHLHCVDLKTGETVWEMDARDDFKATDKRKWGTCTSPLIAGGKLIHNPGGKDASLVALNPKDGKVIWKSPGAPASYGNFIVATLGGKEQVVGFDSESLGGWDLATGKRLWTVKPERRSDFNVPTPIAVDGKLVVAWENNGTLLFRFGKDGKIDPKPQARYVKLAPDMHTPVVAAGRVFGGWNGLHALDLSKGLAQVYFSRDAALSRYVSLVTDGERVLALTQAGALVLWDARAEKFTAISRVEVFKDEAGLYSHPAFVGKRMYARGDSEVVCVELE